MLYFHLLMKIAKKLLTPSISALYKCTATAAATDQGCFAVLADLEVPWPFTAMASHLPTSQTPLLPPIKHEAARPYQEKHLQMEVRSLSECQDNLLTMCVLACPPHYADSQAIPQAFWSITLVVMCPIAPGKSWAHQ